MLASDITADIIIGTHDEGLDMLQDAINRRRKAVRAQARDINLTSFKVGDKVRLKGLSPKYLNGTVATITGKKSTRFVVQMPLSPNLRKWSGSTPTVPAGCVESV